ncbi:MAG: response regulator [Phycisphaerales bacterium]|nr:response regulator [Phycisphaerales bacterium]
MEQRLTDRHVLVVDDDDDIRASMVLALQSQGARISEAADGNEAVAAMHAEVPDAMVLDLMLPGRSGFLVLDEARALAATPVVVMVTANEGRRHEAYAHAHGVDAYFTKPTPLGALVDRIADLLEARP